MSESSLTRQFTPNIGCILTLSLRRKYAGTCPHGHSVAYSLNRREVNVMSKLQSEYDLLREYSRELEEEVASLKTDRINFIRMNERLKEMIIKCEIEVRELRYDTEPPPR